MRTFFSARAFVVAVAAGYRKLSSYSDRGHVRALEGGKDITCYFETAFRKPRLFRFAFKNPHPYPPLRHRVLHHVVGHDGRSPYYSQRDYSGKTSLNRDRPLPRAIAGATGISHGSAHTIGKLLFPKIGGFALTDLKCLHFRADRMMRGVRCAQVSGLHPRGGRVTALIGRDDLLLRKLVHVRMKAEEVRYDINTRRARARYVFHAPAADA